MGCGTACIKYLMFTFNFLVFLGGIALLALGVWAHVSADSFIKSTTDDAGIMNAAYIIIAVGLALLIIGFFGCCGAIKENRCLLGTFFVIILLIFIVEVVGAILAFVFFPRTEEAIRDSMKIYQTSNETRFGWDTIQESLGCCGYDDYKDWEKHGMKDAYPASCCEEDAKECNSASKTLYKVSCKDGVKHFFWVIGAVALGLLFIEIMSMIFACCLYRNCNKDEQYV